MTTERVAIVDTGVANIASLLAAFERIGWSADLTDAASTVAESEYLVLPGVGAFGAGMEMLQEANLVEPLRDRLRHRRATLAICLGMQLLCRRSEESPDVDGLGVVDAEVRRFPDSVRRPQFGWNEVVAQRGCRFLTDGYAYFANSYRIAEVPEEWSIATAEYGGRFVAAMEKGDLLACQFHPEISGRWGLSLLESWLDVEGATC